MGFYHFVNKDEEVDIIRLGVYKNDVFVEGTLKGDLKEWKNMNFEFTGGIGVGTYSTKSYNFKGSIKRSLEGDHEVWHGKS